MPRIAIVGGGIAGLSVAYELTRRGCTSFSLYEASSRLGGTIETVSQDGFVVECGPDSWVTEKPWARELAIELNLEAELLPSLDAHRRNYLLDDGKLIAMPEAMRMMVPNDMEAIASSPLFTDSARQGYREEPARAEELKAAAATRAADFDESVASFVERHFGSEATERVAGPLLSGIFGGDIHELSVRSVMAPFVNMEREYGSLILALASRKRLAGAPPPVFTSLKRGIGSLTDEVAATLPPTSICLNEPVLLLTQTKSNGSMRWEVVTAAGTREFDAVVLATPVHVSRELISSIREELRSLLDMEASSAVVVALGFTREQSASFEVPEGFGFLVPQRAEKGRQPQLLACTFVDQKFEYRAPPGCTLLRAFYGGAEAPRLLAEADETVLALAQQELSKILGRLPRPALTMIRRWPRSLPQYTVGHGARVARVEAIVGEISGLFLIGNAFHGVGLPDLVREGRLLAAKLLESTRK